MAVLTSIKKKSEIEKMRKGGQILASALDLAKAEIEPGLRTKKLEKMIVNFLHKQGAEPSFLNFQGYPAGACVSLNDEIVHGIPGKHKINKGDLVSVDVGVRYQNLYTDAAFTVAVGEVEPRHEELLRITKQSLYDAISVVKPGARLGDIGATISGLAESNGFGVVRDLVGHGVGYSVHEDPQIPNFGVAGQGLILQEGMTLALEPMLTDGSSDVRCLDDDWTFVTADGSMSAHFEHTIVVTDSGAEIITE